MSSFRNHRVVIASLFLPSTAALGESVASTPEYIPPLDPPKLSIPPSAFRLGDIAKQRISSAPETRSSTLVGTTPGPLRSIVDDLKDKVSTPKIVSAHVLTYSKV